MWGGSILLYIQGLKNKTQIPAEFWIEEVFIVRSLRRWAWAAGGTHRCSWHGWRVGRHRWGSRGTLAGCREGSRGAKGIDAPVGPVVSVAKLSSLQGTATVCVWHGRGGPVCDDVRVPPSSTSLHALVTEASLCCPFQNSEEIFQHLQNIVDFSKNVMKEFLGENSVHCGVSDLCLGGHGLRR